MATKDGKDERQGWREGEAEEVEGRPAPGREGAAGAACPGSDTPAPRTASPRSITRRPCAGGCGSSSGWPNVARDPTPVEDRDERGRR